MENLKFLRDRLQHFSTATCGARNVEGFFMDAMSGHSYLAVSDCSILCYRHPGEQVSNF